MRGWQVHGAAAVRVALRQAGAITPAPFAQWHEPGPLPKKPMKNQTTWIAVSVGVVVAAIVLFLMLS